ncbi:hypothetical protein LP123_14320 (plasmid) [Moraxella bovis]|uniref:Uncharacterized protein n=1 Tax=Moraxella bovis TaxID=476 RepID=Q5KT96_MORBO|nr:hypothetical protein [Moraxella bovis]AWY21770.1 hypothetical protein DQF64_14435 [Moraxella bovis]UYZ77069.1 hypothetical protein LP093_13820 [Moraxella bovis]UYZ79741.1 hypothetical protein LP115_13875 [Moraxella bovis]UYZ82531.1 hypothetical protein LP113_14505 [Moraxella bovis]UYZ88228.1 hypothetical protein LP094_13910 [Moraxella bovis]
MKLIKPSDVDFVTAFGCDSYYIDHVLYAVFNSGNENISISISDIQSSIRIIYRINNNIIIDIYKEGAISIKIIEHSFIDVSFSNTIKKSIIIRIDPQFCIELIDFQD